MMLKFNFTEYIAEQSFIACSATSSKFKNEFSLLSQALKLSVFFFALYLDGDIEDIGDFGDMRAKKSPNHQIRTSSFTILVILYPFFPRTFINP